MRIVLGILSWFVLATSAMAAPASIEGSWAGSGTARHKSGTEAVRCRVSYSASTGRTFLFNATCATTAGTFRQSGRLVKVSSSSYRGRAYSGQYRATGKVSVSVSGNRQSIRVTSDIGSASLTLRRR